MYILTGAVFAQTIGVVGFVLWDRTTALQPAIKRSKNSKKDRTRLRKHSRSLQGLTRKWKRDRGTF